MQVFTTDTHLVIVMEHMDGQVLEKMLRDEGCIEEGRARELFRQLVEAVDYAHKQACSIATVIHVCWPYEAAESPSHSRSSMSWDLSMPVRAHHVAANQNRS